MLLLSPGANLHTHRQAVQTDRQAEGKGDTQREGERESVQDDGYTHVTYEHTHSYASTAGMCTRAQILMCVHTPALSLSDTHTHTHPHTHTQACLCVCVSLFPSLSASLSLLHIHTDRQMHTLHSGVGHQRPGWFSASVWVSGAGQPDATLTPCLQSGSSVSLPL